MQVQYVYVKTRSEFGKQCFFDDVGPVVEENILPDPEQSREYVDRIYVDRATQKSTQFALHEAQTTGSTMENRGMGHVEGGWPKEMNSKDPEVTQRFRRRVEKDDNWAPIMRKLMSPMEHRVLQNNAVNIHEHYFDDMIPTELVLSYEARKVNLYVDPEAIPRPINHLSWSPDRATRLAVSYCFTDFEQSPDISLTSYIWDIENPHGPVMGLKGMSASLSIEFNPRDPWMLAGALMSGQVCYWDTRVGDKPAEVSQQHFSHRHSANGVLWTTSKTNTEFFSSSCDGLIKWWDIRSLRKPLDELVMDLEDPQRGDTVRAIGVSAIQFEPTMGAKCMAGMENGVVVNINRKGHNVSEKLATRFKCHKCPVVRIDRNPFSIKHFLTVGYWSVKIWADDVRENDLASVTNLETFLSDGCWSRSRFSVFFTINKKGKLDVYDLLSGVSSPATSIRICEDCLTRIKPHENGVLLAAGSDKGNVYLVECLEGLTTSSKTEKALFSAYLERTGHFEKLIDNRLKELHMSMTGTFGFDAGQTEEPTPRSKEVQTKEKADLKVKIKAAERGASETARRKTKLERSASEAARMKSKLKKSVKSASTDSDLAEAEAKYFETINAELEKYSKAQAAFGVPAKPSAVSPRRKPREFKAFFPLKKGGEAASEGLGEAGESARPSIKPIRYRKAESETIFEDDELLPEEPEPAIRRWKEKILKKICPPGVVCKPTVCCKDAQETLRLAKMKRTLKSRAKRLRQRDVSHSRPSRVLTAKDKYLEDLARTIADIPERSTAAKLRVLREIHAPAELVLWPEVKEARRTLRRWKKDTGYGRYNLRKVLQEMARSEAEKDKKITEESDQEHPLLEEHEPEEKSDTSSKQESRDVTRGHEETAAKSLESVEKSDTEIAREEDGKPETLPIVGKRTKKPDACDIQPLRLPIKEILESAGAVLRDPSILRDEEEEEEPKREVIGKRKEDYPRISAVHTHGPPDESL